MKLRVYLDTSVISAHGDSRLPERQSETLAFFRPQSEVDFVTSMLAAIEIRRTADPRRQSEMLNLLESLEILEITEEMEALARSYIRAGVFSPKQAEDALHVAAAVVSRLSVLVSWNFRHLVNRRRRSMILAVNTHMGYPPIEIIPPPEL